MGIEMDNHCSWDREKILELFKNLQKYYDNSIRVDDFVGLKLLIEKSNPFEILIGILLTQNTSDKNAYKALTMLREKLGGDITPEKILKASPSEIVEAIRIAGLTNRRLNSIIKIARYIYNDREFFDRLKRLRVEDARRELLSLYGVGYKTADVFLLMVYKKPTFPIDTHISRVLTRLGIILMKTNYENIRMAIQGILGEDPDALFKFHILLITHGRVICKARNPKCSICPIQNSCCKIGLASEVPSSS